jgi:hypothetical protein
MNVKPSSRVNGVDGVVSMTRSDIGADTITLVNIFGVEPDRLDWFLNAWRARTQFMSAQPRFRC